MAVTSEPPAWAARAKELWGISFPIVGDPEHQLAHYVIKENIIPNLVITHLDPAVAADASNIYSTVGPVPLAILRVHPWISKYKHGIAQPALSIIRNNRSVAYSMAVQPCASNGFGANDRPMGKQVWDAFKALDGDNTAAKIDKSKIRLVGIIEETYLQLILLGFVATTLILLAWIHGSISSEDARHGVLFVMAFAGGGAHLSVRNSAAATFAGLPSSECKT